QNCKWKIANFQFAIWAGSPDPCSKPLPRIRYVLRYLITKFLQRSEFFLVSQFLDKSDFQCLSIKVASKVEQMRFNPVDRGRICEGGAKAQVQNGAVNAALNFSVSGIHSVRGKQQARGFNVGGWKTELMTNGIAFDNLPAQGIGPAK